MSKRGRCCNGLLTTFRVIQFLLSLIALGCGIWVSYVMFSMASSAHSMEDAIDTLLNPTQVQQLEDQYDLENLDISTDDIEDAGKILNATLVPALHVLEGTPVRAILVSVAALWSVTVIVYLHFAHRSAAKPTHQLLPSEPNTPNLPSHHRPRRNRRSLRVCLSLLTILFWLVGTVAACMLAAEYSIVLFAGGAEMKPAFSILKPLLEKALDSALSGDDHAVARSLDIVDDILTIGALAILAIAASVICAAVEVVSLFVACCMSGKVKTHSNPTFAHAQQSMQSYQQIRSSEADEAALTGYPAAYSPSSPYYADSPIQTEKRPTMVTYSPVSHTGGGGDRMSSSSPLMSMPVPVPVWARDNNNSNHNNHPYQQHQASQQATQQTPQQAPQQQPTNPSPTVQRHGTPTIVVYPTWDDVKNNNNDNNTNNNDKNRHHTTSVSVAVSPSASASSPSPPHAHAYPSPPPPTSPPQRYYAYIADVASPGAEPGIGAGAGRVKRKPLAVA